MPKLPKEKLFVGPALIWKRIVAFAIDFLIIQFFIISPFRKIINKVVPEGSLSAAREFVLAHEEAKNMLLWISFAIGFLILIYFAVLEFSIGQTAGKIIMKIKVVRERKESSSWQFIVRSLFVIPVIPFMLLWIIDPVYMFLNEKNQRFTERISMTRTIETFVM